MTGGSGGPEGIGSTEVSGELKKYQGKYVDIGLDINDSKKEDGTERPAGDWELFYATTDRIFLIAADYVPVTKLTEWGVIGDRGALSDPGFQRFSYYTYNVNWPSTPKTFLKLPDLDVVMHGEYRLDPTSPIPNSIAVSHLLNTAAWDGIKEAAGKKDSIDFVIGGPTLEMWCAAWEVAIKGNPDDLVALEADPQTNGTGYKVKYNGTSGCWLYVTGSPKSKPDSDTLDKYKTFFPHSAVHDGCYGYWLASPSAYDDDWLMNVYSEGEVSCNPCNAANYGVRPVVCLGSGVSLVEIAESGKYTLSK